MRWRRESARLLEPRILHKRRICLFRCLDRSMTQQMLNVSNSCTPAQQASGQRLSQIVRGHICNASLLECSFQFPIVLNCFVATIPAFEYSWR